MTDKIELKTCPFCGGKAFWDSEFSGVYCNCGAELTFFESDKEAAGKWNTRPIEDALKAENKRFKKYSTALEKEVKTLREALEKIVIETNEYERRLPGPSMVVIRLYAEKALKGGEE